MKSHTDYKKLLDISYELNLGHIPSALSMADYLYDVFQIVEPHNNIVLGKPFGAQAYYNVFEEYNYISDHKGLSAGVKHSEIPFVDFSEETLGDALGVAIGMNLADPNNLTYCNLSDASLQMGNTLEALLFILHHKELKNILITIDYNDSQVLGKCSDIIDISPVLNSLYLQNLKMHKTHINYQYLNYIDYDRHNLENYFDKDRVNVFVMGTLKGNHLKEVQKPEWHYRKIKDKNELDLFKSKIYELNSKSDD